MGCTVLNTLLILYQNSLYRIFKLMNGLEEPPLTNLINQLQLKKVSLIQQEPLALL